MRLVNENYRGPCAASYSAYYQRGRGPYGQIFTGTRFPQQRGAGISSILGSVVRGITGLIERTPSWLKEGAKIAEKSALKGISEYQGDIEAGADKRAARKRAFRSAVGEALDQGAKKMRGSGKRKKPRVGKGKKKRCCRLKKIRRVGRGKKARKPARTRRRKSIKKRSKFNLLSV